MQSSKKEFLRKATFLHRSFPTTISFCRYIVKKRERFEVVLIVSVIDEVEGIIDHAFPPKTLWMLQISKLLSKYGTTSWHHGRTSMNRIISTGCFWWLMIPWTQTPSIWHPNTEIAQFTEVHWLCRRPRLVRGLAKSLGVWWKGQRCKNGPRANRSYKWSQKGPLETTKNKWVTEVISSL